MSEPTRSLAGRFLLFCVFVLGGILAIWLALEVLARIWGWVLLVLLLIGLGYLVFVLIRRLQNRW